jgi:hypothetical protein
MKAARAIEWPVPQLRIWQTGRATHLWPGASGDFWLASNSRPRTDVVPL